MSTFWSDLTNSDAFATGALLALGALVIGVVVAASTKRGSVPPIGGYLYAAAAMGAASMSFVVPWQVPLGVLLVAAACALGDAVWDRTLGSLVGSAVLVFGGDVAAGTGAIVLTIGIAACAALVVAFDEAYRTSAIGLPLLAGTALGVLLTVPDTERAMALFGAALPLVLLGWPMRLISVGPAAGAAVALIGWVGGLAGAARPGAAVGSLAALGLMLAAPAGMRIARVTTPALVRIAAGGPGRALLVVAAHGVLVFAASRLAGLQQSAALAGVIVAPFLAAGAVIGAAPVSETAPATAEP